MPEKVLTANVAGAWSRIRIHICTNVCSRDHIPVDQAKWEPACRKCALRQVGLSFVPKLSGFASLARGRRLLAQDIAAVIPINAHCADRYL